MASNYSPAVPVIGTVGVSGKMDSILPALKPFADKDALKSLTTEHVGFLRKVTDGVLKDDKQSAEKLLEADASTVREIFRLLFTARFGWSEISADPHGAAMEAMEARGGNTVGEFMNEKARKATANDCLDKLIWWMRKIPFSEKIMKALHSAAIVETEHHKVREQIYIHCFEWIKSQKSTTLTSPESFRASFSAFLLLLRSCLSDVWSAIRKACAARIVTVFELLSEENLESMCSLLMELCRDPSPSKWRQREGALLVFAGLLKRFQWQPTESYDVYDEEKGSQNRSFHLKFSKTLKFAALPPYLSSSLRVHLFSMLEDDQLSVRENAKKAFVFLLTRSSRWDVYQSFVDVVETLDPSEPRGTGRIWETDGAFGVGPSLRPSPGLLKHRKWWRRRSRPSQKNKEMGLAERRLSQDHGEEYFAEQRGQPRRRSLGTSGNDPLSNVVREDSERANSPTPPPSVNAYGAEGLLSLAVTLIKSLSASFLQKNWAIYIRAFNKYLMHEASTVRQMTSAIFKALVLLSSAGGDAETRLCFRALAFLSEGWELMDVAGSDASKWEWREGRLLALEIVLGFLVSNYYQRRTGGALDKNDKTSANTTPGAVGSPKPLGLPFLFPSNLHDTNSGTYEGPPGTTPIRGNGSVSAAGTQSGNAVPLSPLSPMFPTQYHSPTPQESAHVEHVDVASRQNTKLSTYPVLDRLRCQEVLDGGFVSDDDSPKRSAFSPEDASNATLSSLLRYLLHKTTECHGDQRWEVRRMSAQVLPFLTHVLMLYNWRVMRRFWLNYLSEDCLEIALMDGRSEVSASQAQNDADEDLKTKGGSVDLLTPSPTWPGGIQNGTYVACRSLNFVLSKIDRRFRFSSYGSPLQKLTAPLFSEDGSIDDEGPVGPCPVDFLTLLEQILPSVSVLCRCSRFMRLGCICAEILLRIVVKNERHIHLEGHSILSSKLLALRETLSLSIFSRFARLRSAMMFGEGWNANSESKPEHTSPKLAKGGSAPSLRWAGDQASGSSSGQRRIHMSDLGDTHINVHSKTEAATAFQDHLVRAQADLQIEELRRFHERRKLILHWSAQVHRDLVLRVAPLFEHALFSMTWREAVSAAAVQLNGFLPVMKEEEMHPQTLLLDSVEALFSAPIVAILYSACSQSGSMISDSPTGETSRAFKENKADGKAGRSLLKEFHPETRNSLRIHVPYSEASEEISISKGDSTPVSPQVADQLGEKKSFGFPVCCKGNSLLFRSCATTCVHGDIEKLFEIFLPSLVDLAVSEGLEVVVRRRSLHLLSMIVCLHGDLRHADKFLAPLLRHVYNSCPELREGRARTPRVADAQLFQLFSDDLTDRREDRSLTEVLTSLDLAAEEEDFREDVNHEHEMEKMSAGEADDETESNDWDDWDDEDDEDESGAILAEDVGRFCESLRDIASLRVKVFQRCTAVYLFDRPRKLLEAEATDRKERIPDIDESVVELVQRTLEGITEGELRQRLGIKQWEGNPFDNVVKSMGANERQALFYACSKAFPERQ